MTWRQQGRVFLVRVRVVVNVRVGLLRLQRPRARLRGARFSGAGAGRGRAGARETTRVIEGTVLHAHARSLPLQGQAIAAESAAWCLAIVVCNVYFFATNTRNQK